MKFTIKPLIGVDDIKFGMPKIEVRNLLGQPNSQTRRVDCYFDSILQVHYKSDEVEFIELYEDEIIEALLFNVDVFRTPKYQLNELISANIRESVDANNPEYPKSYVYLNTSLSLWSDSDPSDFSTDEKLQHPEDYHDSRFFKTIGVGRRGYYLTRSSED